MFSPSYLVASRHGILYLRFPIPQSLHPQRLQSYVKVSLGTRCPKEGLHLARGLCYVGEYAMRELRARNMEYQAIRNFLTTFFKGRLDIERCKSSEPLGQISA